MSTQSKNDLQKLATDTAFMWLDENTDLNGLSEEQANYVLKLRGPKKPSKDWPDLMEDAHRTFGASAEFTEADYRELARRDPAFKRKWEKAKCEEVTLAFVRGEKNYVSSDANFQKMVRYMGKIHLNVPNFDVDTGIEQLHRIGRWTVDNLRSAFQVLSKNGQLEVAVGEFRELTSKEKLAVIADVRMGDLDGAINNYVRCAFDGNMPSIGKGRDFAAANPELFAKAVWFIFEQLHAGAISPSEIRAFKTYMRPHRLPNLPMLQNAFLRWSESERSERNKTKSHEPIAEKVLTIEDAQKLSDEELDKAIRDEKRKLIGSR